MQQQNRTPLYVAITAMVIVLLVAAFMFLGVTQGWFVGPTGPQGEPGVAGEQGPQGEQGEQGPPGPTAEAEDAGSVEGAVLSDVSLKLSPDGDYLNWEDEKEQFRQDDGTYMVPVAFLADLSPNSVSFVFEGEFSDTVGEHHVCILDLLLLEQQNSLAANACEVVTSLATGEPVLVFHINQGSFWGYTQDETGWAPDDLLMVFSWNKWQNGQTQTPKFEWPIFVHLTAGDVFYARGVEPDLSEVQQVYRDKAEEDRCPAGADPVLEEPYADSTGGHAVVGAPGGYNCLTLFVGRLTEDGEVLALYWLGAKDLFGYWSEGAAFYRIPIGWGEAEMQDFVAEELGDGINVSSY